MNGRCIAHRRRGRKNEIPILTTLSSKTTANNETLLSIKFCLLSLLFFLMIFSIFLTFYVSFLIVTAGQTLTVNFDNTVALGSSCEFLPK